MCTFAVAPPVGAWIEINASKTGYVLENVAPPVGAWIEIRIIHHGLLYYMVAPPVGAWIEIILFMASFTGPLRRSPCGSVD